MEIDVTSPTSTCTSEVSFSVESSESNQSCIICFCSDEETESHDCTVCKEGAWKICKKCKEKLKRLNKCPVCATENLNYEEPPPPRPPVRQNVIVTERNFMLFNLIARGLWIDVLLECVVYFFKLCVCIMYFAFSFSTVMLITYLTKTTHCFLQYFLGILLSIVWGFVAITLLYDPHDETGRFYRLCFTPILSIIFLTLSGLVNGYCGITFNDRVEVIIIGGSSLLCYSCLIGKILIDEEEIT